MPTERQLTVAARGIAEVLPKQPFHIIVSNFSNQPVRLPKHMLIAYTDEPPASIHYSRKRTRKTHRRGTPEEQCKPLSEPHETVSADHYKPNVDRATKMARHTDVLQEDNQRLAHNWRDKVDLSNNHGQYRQQLIDMLSEFESMWDGHLGRISTAKHRIELSDPNTAPVLSAPPHDGPKTREFERIEVDKMLAENVIEPAQTEWASPIVFTPKMMELSDSASTAES